MKLGCIINLWDGVELLRGAMEKMIGEVDLFIIVYQDVSNFGEPYNPLPELKLAGVPVIIEKFKPTIWEGATNEMKKRNLGLDIARANQCTHFLNIDCDEYYEDFAAAKKEYIDSAYTGSVCPIYTYFKRPTWRLENLDGYFVPFIHELHANTMCGHSSYPFYCDPTRVVNESNVVKLNSVMHHFSWVRKDIERKARNSSAKIYGNMLKGLLADYKLLQSDLDADGYAIKDMGGQKIKIVPDTFGINALLYL